MAKGMTKTQLIRFMAEKLDLSNKQSATFFSTLVKRPRGQGAPQREVQSKGDPR